MQAKKQSLACERGLRAQMRRILSCSFEQASVWMAARLLSDLDDCPHPNHPLCLPLLTLPLAGGVPTHFGWKGFGDLWLVYFFRSCRRLMRQV